MTFFHQENIIFTEGSEVVVSFKHTNQNELRSADTEIENPVEYLLTYHNSLLFTTHFRHNHRLYTTWNRPTEIVLKTISY